MLLPPARHPRIRERAASATLPIVTADSDPLLEGPAAERAIEHAIEIASVLSSPGPLDMWQTGASLSRGMSGIALFFANLGEVTGDARHAETAAELVAAAAGDVAGQTSPDAGLYGSTVGLGWVLTTLSGRLFEADDEDPGTDEFVEKLLSLERWPGHYDLITGLVGLGTYWLPRLPQPRALAGLERVVEHLATEAEREDGRATWFTAPDRYWARAGHFPEGHYDAGFAHGVAGAVALLAEASRAGVPGATPLLADSVEWLVQQRRPDGEGGSRYPGTFTGDTTVRDTARLAWCYGDPGVAVALTAAGLALGSADVMEEALTTARGCARQVEGGKVEDASLCHGSSGAAHVLSRLARAHGDSELRDIATFWIGQTLESRGDGPCIGYLRRNSAAALTADDAWAPCAGVLEGAAGAGLALISATVPHTWWDGFYLVSDLA